MKRSLLAGALLTALLLGACGTRKPVTLTETDRRTAAVAADFSLLSDTPLKIDAVQQKTYLQVDESGTIGAAVTSLPIMATTAVETEPPKYVELTRPYLCVIFDHETQSIVFLGIVNQIS